MYTKLLVNVGIVVIKKQEVTTTSSFNGNSPIDSGFAVEVVKFVYKWLYSVWMIVFYQNFFEIGFQLSN